VNVLRRIPEVWWLILAGVGVVMLGRFVHPGFAVAWVVGWFALIIGVAVYDTGRKRGEREQRDRDDERARLAEERRRYDQDEEDLE
jgi:hypothetical protein